MVIVYCVIVESARVIAMVVIVISRNAQPYTYRILSNPDTVSGDAIPVKHGGES